MRLNLGPGALVDSVTDLHAYKKNRFPPPPLPDYASKTISVVTDPNDDVAPVELGVQFANVMQYGISAWVRQVAASPTSLLFRLTQNPKPQDFQNPGDRALSAFLTSEANIVFSTYTALDDDQFKCTHHLVYEQPP